MKAIGIEPFLAERVVAAGQNVPKKIAGHIRTSNAFIPFLTTSSLANQWVNQEIGYAFRWMEEREIDSPYFFPVLEERLNHSAKGFLGIPVTEYIPLRMDEPNQAIYKLLLSLRKYINRNVDVLEQLYIICPACMRRFPTEIPPQEKIDAAIEKKKPLERVCRSCHVTMTINPYTLMVEAHVGGQRW
jgi:hypothetical protein